MTVDSDERGFRRRELELQEEALGVQRDSARSNYRLARISVILSLLAIGTSLTISYLTLRQSAADSRRSLDASTEQFRQNSRSDLYTDIVNGLGSPAAAVQTSSMRRLVAFVENDDNFAGDEAQGGGAVLAIQTLMAFIEDQSTVPGQRGLSDYQSPQPIVLSRAMQQLQRLHSNTELGAFSADISRANLHGIYLPNYTPSGSLEAESADFRRATLTKLDVSAVKAADFSYGYFTCAGLDSALFGAANLSDADLSGADLRGADLSRVTGLTRAQLHGTTIGPMTQLPPDITLPVRDGWGLGSRACVTLANRMTGFQAGFGYVDSKPCPLSRQEARRTTYQPAFTGRPADLVKACRIRAGLAREVRP